MLIFKSNERQGSLQGKVDIASNSGGRTDIEVHIYQNAGGDTTHIEFVERLNTTFIELSSLEKSIESNSKEKFREKIEGNRIKFGRLDGNAYPTKFVPLYTKINNQ